MWERSRFQRPRLLFIYVSQKMAGKEVVEMKVELTEKEVKVILDALSEENIGTLPLSKDLRATIMSIREKLEKRR